MSTAKIPLPPLSSHAIQQRRNDFRALHLKLQKACELKAIQDEKERENNLIQRKKERVENSISLPRYRLTKDNKDICDKVQEIIRKKCVNTKRRLLKFRPKAIVDKLEDSITFADSDNEQLEDEPTESPNLDHANDLEDIETEIDMDDDTPGFDEDNQSLASLADDSDSDANSVVDEDEYGYDEEENATAALETIDDEFIAKDISIMTSKRLLYPEIVNAYDVAMKLLSNPVMKRCPESIQNISYKDINESSSKLMDMKNVCISKKVKKASTR